MPVGLRFTPGKTLRSTFPNIATGGLWNRRAKPSLVVIVPADSPELVLNYFLTLLHKEKSITRKSVYYKEDPSDKERVCMFNTVSVPTVECSL